MQYLLFYREKHNFCALWTSDMLLVYPSSYAEQVSLLYSFNKFYVYSEKCPFCNAEIKEIKNVTWKQTYSSDICEIKFTISINVALYVFYI